LFNAWLKKQEARAEAFKCELHKVDGKKAAIASEAGALELEERIKDKPFIIAEVQEKERKKDPKPPFITSTLQQTANQRLGYTAKRTMNIAQRLYEGIDLESLGTVALITYMRTDSVRIAAEALEAAQKFIVSAYGKEYGAPGGKRVFRSKGGAQDAHEAIRPVDVNIVPDEIKSLLTQEQYQLYKLIWTRFVASQMAPARFHDTTVIIENGPAEWRVKGERILFPGYLTVFSAKDESILLPDLCVGEELALEKLVKEQKFTQPPARYNEASLVKELEDKGIGRPSTYASIISTLLDREYAVLQEKTFVPTDLGTVVCELLKEHFTNLMDVGFTAKMEDNLDKVADGNENWKQLLGDFSKDFNATLAEAGTAMQAVKAGMPTGLSCPDCGKDLIIKFGKAGAFAACSGYPACTFSSNFERDESGRITLKEKAQVEREKVGSCPQCNGDLVIKTARTGSRFIACNNYPKCTHARPFSTGVHCPKCAEGFLVEKSSKRGKIFYGCDQYPNCDFAIWDWPIDEPCPACGSKVLCLKTTRGVKRIACPEKNCRYSRPMEE
ncbi:MAG: type I DNA topoisomerase, partial [Desulfovibrionaceae bacterium]|nr:type I DNA topoisomerase [Desulfovibrionaceae bacterium]